MQLEQFRYALEIAKCGSITQAAKNLFVAQPSLTIAIQKLEAELGFNLFIRSQKGVQITEKGEKALTYIQQILSLTEDLTSLSPAESNTPIMLQLVAFPMFFDLLEESLFSQIHAMHPNLNFKIIEQTASQIQQEIQNGSYYFAISGSPSPAYQTLVASMKAKKSNVTLQILYQEPLFLLLPKTHPLLSKEAIYIEDLHQETLLYFGEHLQKNHVALLENYQFQFKETTPFYRRTSIQKAISMGQGISIMTKSQVCNDPLYLEGQIVARPIVDFHNTYVHYLIFNKRHIFSRIETDILQRIQSLYHSLEKHTLS